MTGTRSHEVRRLVNVLTAICLACPRRCARCGDPEAYTENGRPPRLCLACIHRRDKAGQRRYMRRSGGRCTSIAFLRTEYGLVPLRS